MSSREETGMVMSASSGQGISDHAFSGVFLHFLSIPFAFYPSFGIASRALCPALK